MDAALASTDRVPLIEHLQGCAACRAEHVKLERAKAALAAASFCRMPEALRSRIAGMIGEEEAVGEQASWRERLLPVQPRWALAGSMAAVLLVVAAAQWLPAEKETTVPLKALLAEHVRSTRKSADIQRAVLVSAPYDFVTHNQEMQ